MNQDSTVIVTGGAGFIGSTLVRQCLAVGSWSVVTIDKLTYAGNRCSLTEVLDNPRHELVEGDVADAALVAELLKRHRPQAVIHLAAESHVDRSIAGPPQFATTNALGTCVLLDEVTRYWQQLKEAEQQAFRCLLVSTDEVFGSANPDESFDEQSPFAPNSPYAASKAAGEHFARAFSQTYGLPVVVANSSNNFGPRQHPEKLIPKMILHAAAGQSLPVYGDGLHQRDWLHVEDCGDALLEILRAKKPSSRYVIGAENCLTNLHVVELICDFLDELLGDGKNRRKLIASTVDRLGHDRRYAVDAGRLRSETHWLPKIGFEGGLRETVRWYLENPGWVAEVSRREESGPSY